MRKAYVSFKLEEEKKHIALATNKSGKSDRLLAQNWGHHHAAADSYARPLPAGPKESQDGPPDSAGPEESQDGPPDSETTVSFPGVGGSGFLFQVPWFKLGNGRINS